MIVREVIVLHMMKTAITNIGDWYAINLQFFEFLHKAEPRSAIGCTQQKQTILHLELYRVSDKVLKVMVYPIHYALIPSFTYREAMCLEAYVSSVVACCRSDGLNRRLPLFALPLSHLDKI